jgi:hypothetical protein
LRERGEKKWRKSSRHININKTKKVDLAIYLRTKSIGNKEEDVWLNRDRKNMIWKAVQIVERRKV